MLERHMTRDGDSLLIAQMSDDHLRNTIRLAFRNMEEAVEISKNEGVDEYQRELYGLPRIAPEDAARANRTIVRGMYPYFAEAYLRNMSDIQEELVAAMKRSENFPGGILTGRKTLAQRRRDAIDNATVVEF